VWLNNGFGDRLRESGYLYAEFSYRSLGKEYRDFVDAIALRDIVIKTENMGYGSLLLQHLIRYARQLGVREIRGRLSPVDNTDDNRDRLKHFYEKFGFQVDGDMLTLQLKTH